jgi:two-component system, LytTR family, response regulator
MVRTLIIDDEPRAASLLRKTIEDNFKGEFDIETSLLPQEALAMIGSFKPELIYLDIEMPGMTGFELLATLPSIDFKVIFTTAHDHYAIRAIRYNALDYLLKPVNADELTGAIDRFHQQKHDGHDVYRYQLTSLLSQQEKTLAITTYDGIVFLEIDKIIRCEADLNYTRFILAGDKYFVSSKTLKEYEDLLCTHSNFMRVHRSHLVNIDYLLKFKHDGSLLLKDDSVIPVSRRRKEFVMQKLCAPAK